MIDTELSQQPTFTRLAPSTALCNFTSGSTPTANDDETEGFAENSIWYKATFPYRIWKCVDATEGAAVWREIRLADDLVFDRLANSATTGTSSQDLWSDTLSAGKLAENGDHLEAVYAVTFAANANQKLVWIEWFGNAFLGIDTTQSGGSARIKVVAMRLSSTKVGVSVINSHGSSTSTEYAEITGLTLSNAQALKLRGRTPSAAGDLTARMAKCSFDPSANRNQVIYGGETVLYGSNGEVVFYGS